MAGKTSEKSANTAKKTAAKSVAPAKPRKAAAKSQSRKAAKPVLFAGDNPQVGKAYAATAICLLRE